MIKSSRTGGICESPAHAKLTVHRDGYLCLSRVKEASTGYFHDLHMTRFHGGKTWMAPSVLIREDVRSGVMSTLTCTADWTNRKRSGSPMSSAHV